MRGVECIYEWHQACKCMRRRGGSHLNHEDDNLEDDADKNDKYNDDESDQYLYCKGIDFSLVVAFYPIEMDLTKIR